MKKELPVFFVRELVVFPGMSVTVTVGREPSRLAVLESKKAFNSSIVSMTQLRAEDSEIKNLDAVYKIGTICRIEKVLALSDGGMQVQVEGLERFEGQSLKWQNGTALVTGSVLLDKDSCTQAETAELSEIMSSYQPVNFDKLAWLERKDAEELNRINQRIAAQQLILQEPSAKARVQMLKAIRQKS